MRFEIEFDVHCMTDEIVRVEHEEEGCFYETDDHNSIFEARDGSTIVVSWYEDSWEWFAYSARISGHVDYPHAPGYLWDCEACELGPCKCEDTLGNAECVSVNCTRIIDLEEC